MRTTKVKDRLGFYCQVIIILLGLITVRLWTLPVDALPHAMAQIPDEGAQRQQIVKAVEKSNKLLAETNHILKGTITVRIEDSKPTPANKPSTPSKGR